MCQCDCAHSWLQNRLACLHPLLHTRAHHSGSRTSPGCARFKVRPARPTTSQPRHTKAVFRASLKPSDAPVDSSSPNHLHHFSTGRSCGALAATGAIMRQAAPHRAPFSGPCAHQRPGRLRRAQAVAIPDLASLASSVQTVVDALASAAPEALQPAVQLIGGDVAAVAALSPTIPGLARLSVSVRVRGGGGGVASRLRAVAAATTGCGSDRPATSR
jgi:hypothetical protein